jgi:hypothetical protein
MRHFMTGGVFILATFGLLIGCNGPEPSGRLPQTLAENSLQSQSYSLSFYENEPDRSLTARNGQALSMVLQELMRDPPGYIRFQSLGERPTERDLLRLLEDSGLNRYSAIEVAPAVPAPEAGGPALKLEMTYFTYALGDCGAHLHRRLIDHEAWGTPGFGCAVNRNRLVSLVRPGNAGSGGYLTPPLAGPEVKAITSYQTRPPTPFPPANK